MSKESEDKIGEIEDRIAQRPREWWIDSDCDGYGIWRGPELGEMEGAVHVIEHSAYEKVCAELAHLKYNAMADENAFRQELDTLRAENDKLKAQLWVAKDSALRTYDGLAEKADKYDALM